MIQGLATPAHMKLQLIPILQHMHHDTSTAAMVNILTSKKKIIVIICWLKIYFNTKHDKV